MYSGVGLLTEASPLHWVYANSSSMSVQLVSYKARYSPGMHELLKLRHRHAPQMYKHFIITHEHEGNYLQNSDVLEPGKVTLGDACEVISIQLSAKTDTQTCMNNSALFSL